MAQRAAPPGPTPAGFAEAMAGHAAGVAVVTVADGDEPRGLVVTSLSSYSADPPSVMAAIAHASRSHDALAACDAFGVHLLAHGQNAVAAAFISRADDKFAQLDWDWDGGVPRLGGVRAFMRCRREATFAHGDHSIVVGAVDALEAGAADLQPLVYWRRELDWRLTAESPAG